MLTKSWLVSFLLVWIFLNCDLKSVKLAFKRIKIRLIVCSQILDQHLKKIKFEQKQGFFSFFIDFREKLNLSESALFHCELVGLTNFRLDIHILLSI